MGYTHYWHPAGELPKAKWSAFQKDVKAILKASPTPVVFEMDDPKPPQVTAERVRFNGKGEDGYETFVFQRYDPEGFAFCKTDRRAYDPVVCAVLLAADHHFGKAVKVTSDGEWPEWRHGAELYQKATGRVPVKPAEVNS